MSKEFSNALVTKMGNVLKKFLGIVIPLLAKLEAIMERMQCSIRMKLEPQSEKNLIIKQNMFPNFASIVEVLGTRQKNKFYPANPSLWIVFVSCFMGILIILFVSILHSQEFISGLYKQFFVAILGCVLALTFWISLFYKEKMYGYHTDIIKKNIMLSFWVFLFTEGLCFMSLFWTFFHAMLAASTHIGQYCPGEGIVNYYLSEAIIMHPCWSLFFLSEFPETKVINIRTDSSKHAFDSLLCIKLNFNLYDKGQLINPYGYPLLNTLLLLASAAILNASHVKLKLSKYLFSFMLLILTIAVGFVFLFVQFLEIRNCTLQYNDGIYACTFYSLTGLHGIHVILGVFALIMCLVNFTKGNYTKLKHDTYWCSIAYWHFVDIVWVLVYLLIYCWPSCFYYAEYIKYSYLGQRHYCLNINVPIFEKNFIKEVITLNADLTIDFLSIYSEARKKKIIYFEIPAKNFAQVITLKFILSNDLMYMTKQAEYLKHKISIFYIYNELYNAKAYLNYEEMTKDKHFYAISLNILHTITFDYLSEWAKLDLLTWRGKIKFPVLYFLYYININWAFVFASKFTPYLVNNDFKCMWGDLLYTKKPKWVIIKN